MGRRNALVIILLLAHSLCFADAGFIGEESVTNSTSSSTTYGSTATGSQGRFTGSDYNTTAYGKYITVTTGGTVSAIGGFWTSTSGIDRTVYMALYERTGTQCDDLVGTPVSFDVPASSTDADLYTTYNSQSIASGDYCIAYMTSYAGASPTYETESSARPTITLTTPQTFPSDWSAETQGTTGNVGLALYIRVQ